VSKNSYNDKTKDELVVQWKMLRGKYFNIFDEDKVKFKKKCSHDPLYESVVKHFDKSFMEVNQIAESEIDYFLNSMGK